MVYGWLGPTATSYAQGTVEWYVIDNYDNKWTGTDYLGQVYSDGSNYDCYRSWSDLGFWQFTAFRLNKRNSGDVTLRNFMQFWRQHSMPNDFLIEVGIGCENFNGGAGRWEGSNIYIPAVNEGGAPTYTVYSDALASDWQNWSWSTNVNLGATSPVKVGSNSISATSTAGYSALSLRKGPHAPVAGSLRGKPGYLG